MRAPWLAALGVAAYLVFLAASMPASFVLARMAEAERGRLQVRSASGTAWHGDARLTVDTPGGPVAIDRLEWRFLPTRLASGRIAYAVHAEVAGFDGRYEAGGSLSGWEVRGLEARGDAAQLPSLLPSTAPWRPEGALHLTSPLLSTDGQQWMGEARIEWRGAAVGLSQVRPLGSYRIDLRAEGAAGNVVVTTLEGPLRVSGQGRLAPPGRLTFTGEARAEGDQASALAPLLDLLGPARPDGARAISWQAR
jgi:general secretion pathway protein N